MKNIDINVLKNLLDGKEVVYKYLREKKGYYLDPLTVRVHC